jgi:hypothetical protein
MSPTKHPDNALLEVSDSRQKNKKFNPDRAESPRLDQARRNLFSDVGQGSSKSFAVYRP